MQQPPELHSSPLLATQNGEYMYTQNTPKFQHPHHHHPPKPTNQDPIA